MKTLRIIFLLLLPSSAFADEFADNYGIGILDINTSKPNTNVFLLYSDDTADGYIHIKFDTVMKVECTDYKYEMLKHDPILFAPEVFHKSEGCNPYKLQFFCIEKKGGMYKVRCGNIQNISLWLKTDCEVKIIPFIDFYKQMCSVEMNADSDYVFRDKPNAKMLTPVVLDANTPFKKSSFRLKPILIKGDWMQVDIEFSNDHKPMKLQRLWIKWRDDKKPLITYNIMCC